MTEAIPEPAVALLFADADLGAHLRESLQALGARIVHEGTPAAVSRQDLIDSGADVVVVNLDESDDDQLDHLYEVIDEDRQRVLFNDASASRVLSGWDRARWARHLAVKLLGRGDVDPPRPASARAIEPVIAPTPPLAATPDVDSVAQTDVQDAALSAPPEPMAQSAPEEGVNVSTVEAVDTDTLDLDDTLAANSDEIRQLEALNATPDAFDPASATGTTLADESSTPFESTGVDTFADVDEPPQSSRHADRHESGPAAEPLVHVQSDSQQEWMQESATTPEFAGTSEPTETPEPAEAPGPASVSQSAASVEMPNWDAPMSLDLTDLIQSVRSSGHAQIDSAVTSGTDTTDDNASVAQHGPGATSAGPFDADPNPESIQAASESGETQALDGANSPPLSTDEPASKPAERLHDHALDDEEDFSWSIPDEVGSDQVAIGPDDSEQFTPDATYTADAAEDQTPPLATGDTHESASIIDRQTVSSLPPVEEWDLVDLDAHESPAPAQPAAQREDASTFGVHKVQAKDHLAPHAEDGESPVSPGMTLELVSLEQAVAPRAEEAEPVREMSLNAASCAIRTLVVLAATADGASAISTFVAALKSPVRALLLCVQHHHDDDTEALAASLGSDSALRVRVVEDGMQAQTNQVLVLPAGKRCQIDRDGRVHMQTVTSRDANDPSIDDCLTSASSTFGTDLLALIFSGDANDTLAGAQAVHDRRGRVWVQDPQTCVANGMAALAIEDGLAEFVGSPTALAARLGEVLA